MVVQNLRFKTREDLGRATSTFGVTGRANHNSAANGLTAGTSEPPLECPKRSRRLTPLYIRRNEVIRDRHFVAYEISPAYVSPLVQQHLDAHKIVADLNHVEG
jgi:hypothetical protein